MQISRVESGTMNVTLSTLVAYAVAFKVSVADLFDRGAVAPSQALPSAEPRPRS